MLFPALPHSRPRIALIANDIRRQRRRREHAVLEIAHLLPVDKHDLPKAEAVVALGYPAVEALLPELITWMQDINWPVAKILTPFLAGIGEPLAPHLRMIFESEDHVWKYRVLDKLVAPSPRLAVAVEPYLLRMALEPSLGESGEEVDEIARRILAKTAA
ncbi:DUF5071 domain-containing protein [Variovorax sp. W2I14]|uniref:DUF5071 domain-containing protein n=1 Tax=Variovorax sp. W2I14 TaxID=3042290 RepID=UPI003D238BDA